MNPQLRQALDQLNARKSIDRRRAARKLRVIRQPSAGAAILTALQREVLDVRTWETQYHMIMALGECGYQESLPFLRELASRRLEAKMVYLALGDAIVRLARNHEQDPNPILEALESDEGFFVDGSLRAMAMLRLTLNPEAVATIVRYAMRQPKDHFLRFWVGVAAAGWSGPEVLNFLQDTATSSREDVAQAARVSLTREYSTYRPL